MLELDYQTATPEEKEFIEDIFLHQKLGGAYHSKGKLFHELGALKKYWTRRLSIVRISFTGTHLNQNIKYIFLSNGYDMSKHYVKIVIPMELYKEKTSK